MTKRGRAITIQSETSPCVGDCPRRSATCHAGCPDYAAFAAKRAEAYAKRESANRINDLKKRRLKNSIRKRERGI